MMMMWPSTIRPFGHAVDALRALSIMAHAKTVCTLLL